VASLFRAVSSFSSLSLRAISGSRYGGGVRRVEGSEDVSLLIIFLVV